MAARKTHSEEERDEIVAFIAMLLSQQVTKGQIKNMVRNQYASKEFSARTLETYVSRAREKVAEWSGLDATKVREQIIAMLQGMFTGSLKPFERLAVVDRFMMLFNLAPAEVNLHHSGTGPGGAVVNIIEIVDGSAHDTDPRTPANAGDSPAQ